VARAISDGDEIVGDVLTQTPPFGGVAPFIYQNGISTDLNALLPRKSGWELLTAAGVTVDGEVIGTGYRNGVLRGYALQP
jgi:hypothetical protein